jgi:hypothetical protein
VLYLFASVDSPSVIDYSKVNRFDSESRHQKGTLQNLLKCHGDGSKILNALDFPMPAAPHPPTAFASDIAAFNTTIDLPMCGRNVLFPAMSTRWGLAATSGAYHLWHIDCNGFSTYIDTQTGKKWWIVARPKKGSAHFSDTELFMKGFDIDGANLNKWDIEAVLLLPGSRLCVISTHRTQQTLLILK